MPDQVDAVAATIPYDHYARRSDGSMIPQTSSPEVIAELIRLLGAGLGAHVLEIGTGSGYSTALLARLVGPTGHVTSIDVDATLTDRARVVLADAGIANVSIHCGDGVCGCGAEAPYTHVVAWAAAEAVPEAWVEQAAPGATIVAPVELAPLAKASKTVRVRVTGPDRVEPDRFVRASFVTLHPVVLTAWAVPARHVDLVLPSDEGDSSTPWISAPWLRDPKGENGAHAARTLDGMMAADLHPGPLSADEDAAAFEEFLYSLEAPDITQASLHGGDVWMGMASLDGFAMIQRPNIVCWDAPWIVGGSSRSRVAMEDAVRLWRATGRPSILELRPSLTRIPSGWRVGARRSEE